MAGYCRFWLEILTRQLALRQHCRADKARPHLPISAYKDLDTAQSYLEISLTFARNEPLLFLGNLDAPALSPQALHSIDPVHPLPRQTLFRIALLGVGNSPRTA